MVIQPFNQIFSLVQLRVYRYFSMPTEYNIENYFKKSILRYQLGDRKYAHRKKAHKEKCPQGKMLTRKNAHKKKCPQGKMPTRKNANKEKYPQGKVLTCITVFNLPHRLHDIKPSFV